MATRNQILSQSVALYSSPITGDRDDGAGVPTSDITALQRVTDVNWGGEVARQDINVIGQLASLSREVIEEPTVSLDFSYYLSNGFNESGAMGLNVSKDDLNTNLIANILQDTDGQAERNYYILTVGEGIDANDTDTPSETSTHGIFGIGNAFITNYSVSLSVGEIPSSNVSFEAANLTFATGGPTGTRNPAINRSATLPAVQYTGNLQLPEFFTDAGTGLSDSGNLTATVLRPGDITLDFGADDLEAGGVILDGMTEASTKQEAHVQSVSIDVPLSRTPLNKLGNPFAFSRKLDVPINTTLTVSANVGDVVTGSLVDLVCGADVSRDITIHLSEKCGGTPNMRFAFKGCQLDSQSMSQGIGDSQTVDLTFSAQIGGANDQSNGLFISGRAV